MKKSTVVIALFLTISIYAGDESNLFTVDGPRVVAATDVTPASIKDAKIIELILEPSSRSQNAEILELSYKIKTNHNVADYLPQTTMVQNNTGDVEFTSSVVNFNGRIFYAMTPRAGKGNTSFQFQKSALSMKRLPPLDTLLVSGYEDRGQGVFFDFQDNDRTTLKGRKEIAIILRVPLAFSADFLTVHAEGKIEYGGGSPYYIRQDTFEDEYIVAFYLDSSPDAADLREEAADIFLLEEKLDEKVVTAKKNFAEAARRYDKKKGWFRSPPQKFQDAVNEAKKKHRDALKKAEQSPWTEFRKKHSGKK